VIVITDGSGTKATMPEDDGRVGSLMRHFFPVSAVPGLAGGVVEPAGTAVLIEPAGPLQRDPTRMTRAGARAVAMSAVADPAQEEQLLAIRSDADHQPQRIHTLPRSGRGGGGWTTTRPCAKKGAADCALPRCVPPEGPRCRDSGPSPLSAVGGNGLPQLTVRSQTDPTVSQSQIPRFLVIVNIVGTGLGPSAARQGCMALSEPAVRTSLGRARHRGR
jgi:hypothetical protein